MTPYTGEQVPKIKPIAPLIRSQVTVHYVRAIVKKGEKQIEKVWYKLINKQEAYWFKDLFFSKNRK